MQNDCEKCKDIWDNIPPCSPDFKGDNICDKPDNIMPCNYQAWHWFNEIAKRDRPITGFGGLLYLPRLTVLRICEYHGLDMDTAEKILLIDDVYVPIRSKQIEEQREREKKK